MTYVHARAARDSLPHSFRGTTPNVTALRWACDCGAPVNLTPRLHAGGAGGEGEGVGHGGVGGGKGGGEGGGVRGGVGWGLGGGVVCVAGLGDGVTCAGFVGPGCEEGVGARVLLPAVVLFCVVVVRAKHRPADCAVAPTKHKHTSNGI